LVQFCCGGFDLFSLVWFDFVVVHFVWIDLPCFHFFTLTLFDVLAFALGLVDLVSIFPPLIGLLCSANLPTGLVFSVGRLVTWCLPAKA
jgi:hypothetical protein